MKRGVRAVYIFDGICRRNEKAYIFVASSRSDEKRSEAYCGYAERVSQ